MLEVLGHGVRTVVVVEIENRSREGGRTVWKYEWRAVRNEARQHILLMEDGKTHGGDHVALKSAASGKVTVRNHVRGRDRR